MDDGARQHSAPAFLEKLYEILDDETLEVQLLISCSQSCHYSEFYILTRAGIHILATRWEKFFNQESKRVSFFDQ